MKVIQAALEEFQGFGIHTQGDAHLPDGVHLRLLLNPELGLPARPFEIYRQLRARPTKGLRQIRWVAADGSQLQTPFNVTPDNPVTGYLREPAVIVQLEAEADSYETEPLDPIPPPLPELPPWLRRLRSLPQDLMDFSRRVFRRLPDIGRSGEQPQESDPTEAQPTIVGAEFSRRKLGMVGNLHISAAVNTSRGLSRIATVSVGPYVLTGSRITHLIVEGKGTVSEADYLTADVSEVTQDEFWRKLDFPVTGVLYEGLPNANQNADQRIRRGAPQRQPMYQAVDSDTVQVAPGALPQEEINRLAAIRPTVNDWLSRLLNVQHKSVQISLQESWDVQDAAWQTTPNRKVSATVPLLPLLLQAAIDPGVARYLGLMDSDEHPLSSTDEDLLLYVVRGQWYFFSEDEVDDVPREAVEWFGRGGVLPGDPTRGTGREPGIDVTRPINALGLVSRWTVIPVMVGVPPDRPAPPEISRISGKGWIPLPPPQALREIELAVRRLLPGALVALGRQGPDHPWQAVHRDADGPLPLVAAAPPDADEANTGRFFDRQAPPPALRYRIGQSDWYGRWSRWREMTVGARKRPLPPRPTLEAGYQPPSFDATNLPTGSLSGTLQIVVPVPAEDGLPPGSHLLQSLQIDVQPLNEQFQPQGSRSRFTIDPQNATVSSSAGGQGQRLEKDDAVLLALELPGPAIARAARQHIRIVTRWQDTAGRSSTDATTLERTLYDPRPPESVSIPGVIVYTSRPDAQNRASFTLTWPVQPGQPRFRVYYSDETRLRGTFNGNLPAQLRADQDVVTRAQYLKDHPADLPREAFETLTVDPLDAPASGSEMSYRHSVSGSLQVLGVYRVVAVSEANVEAPFIDADVVPVAVPIRNTPPAPVLAVRAITDSSGALLQPPQVEIEVKVAPGSVPAARCRIRRSQHYGGDPLLMPIAVDRPITDSGTRGGQQANMRDTGAYVDLPDTSLALWTPYYWVGEVRGAALPGQGPPGEWSEASMPVSLTLIPPQAPPAPSQMAIQNDVGGVRLSWKLPQRLRGGQVGVYRFDVYGVRPDSDETLLMSVEAGAAEVQVASDGTARYSLLDMHQQAGQTRYRIIVVDPIGRMSPPGSAIRL